MCLFPATGEGPTRTPASGERRLPFGAPPHPHPLADKRQTADSGSLSHGQRQTPAGLIRNWCPSLHPCPRLSGRGGREPRAGIRPRQPMLSIRPPWKGASRLHLPAAPAPPSAATAKGESSCPSPPLPSPPARGSREPNFLQGHFIAPINTSARYRAGIQSGRLHLMKRHAKPRRERPPPPRMKQG